MDVTNCVNCEICCVYLNSQISFVCMYLVYSTIGVWVIYSWKIGTISFVIKSVVSPFQYLLATIHPALTVDCVMNPSLDSIAHVSKDIMERFAKLKVD